MKKTEIRNYLKEDSREKKWPKGEDPSHQNNQTPSKTCVGIDVVPGVVIVLQYCVFDDFTIEYNG